jgi:hypothetical protein
MEIYKHHIAVRNARIENSIRLAQIIEESSGSVDDDDADADDADDADESISGGSIWPPCNSADSDPGVIRISTWSKK